MAEGRTQQPIRKLPTTKAVKGRTGEQSAHQSFTEEDALFEDFLQKDERVFQTESLGHSVSEEAGLRESNEERSSENSSLSDDGKDSVGSENGDDGDSIVSENGSSIAVIKKKSKSTKRANVKCYACIKTGHYKSECPQAKKLEEVHLLNTPICLQNLDEAPSRMEEKKAFLKSTREPVVVVGKVDGQKVSTVYLDPGSSKTFVKADWVCDSRLTGKNVEVSTVNPGQAVYPMARVEVEVAGYQTEIVVGVHEGLKYDVLLGRDFPYLWEVGFREVNLATCAIVKTRQVTKQESVLKPDKPGKVVTGDDLTEHEFKEANDSITENKYSEIVAVSDDDVCQESSEKLDDNSSGNTDHNEVLS